MYIEFKLGEEPEDIVFPLPPKPKINNFQDLFAVQNSNLFSI
jgi:hypothetical protein